MFQRGAVLLFGFMVAGVAVANPFVGAWELVSGKYIDGDKVIIYEEKKMKSIKVLSDKHFSFISKSGDKFWAAGGGTYTFNKKEYTEVPKHTSYGAAPGVTYTFEYRIEGDKWHNTRWEGDIGVEYEVWRKLD